MFTEARIALSALAGPLALDVRRDAMIAYVGKVPTRLPHRLVPCAKPAHLADAARQDGIVAYVVPEALADVVPADAGLVIDDRPVLAAMTIHEHLAAIPGFQWIDFASRIDPSAVVGPGAVIAPRNVVVGARSVIGPNAVLAERTIIGAHCSVGPGVALGIPAFEQVVGARPKRILRQSGGVWCEDHAGIEANSTVSRATFGGFTRIGAETQIDAQCYIAHDCDVGARVTICSAVSVNGRVRIGEDAYLGPNATISNGLDIGSRAIVSLGAVVTRDVPSGARVTGNFALPHERWLSLLREHR